MRSADEEFQIRAAQGADLPAVLALVTADEELPRWPRDVWEVFTGMHQDRLRGRQMLLGVDATGGLRGLAAGMTVSDVAELEYVWVDRQCRGRGLGRALLECWLTWARGHGAAEVFLEVRASNEAAMSLYRRLGFVEQGLRREYYQMPPEDARVMRLELRGPEEAAL